MTKKYAIGIDLGGTSVKYALIDNEGVFYFQGKLPSKADVSAEAVIGQLVTAINEVKAFAQEKSGEVILIDTTGKKLKSIITGKYLDDCGNGIISTEVSEQVAPGRVEYQRLGKYSLGRPY